MHFLYIITQVIFTLFMTFIQFADKVINCHSSLVKDYVHTDNNFQHAFKQYLK